MHNTSGSTWAVITGASSGIGAAFARKLAQRGFHLLLVARCKERLDELGRELESGHNVKTAVWVTDLADGDAVDRLARQVSDMADLELLVNNAGFGKTGYFADVDPQPHLNVVRVHVLATVRLTRAALPGMIRRGRGAIINVSSLAAWLTCAGSVQYAATKAYLNVFSEALQQELLGTGVRIQALCPGFTHTEFHHTANMRGFDKSQVASWLWMSADDVVEESLKSLKRKKVIVIPGWKNRIIARIAQSTWLRPWVRSMARRRAEQELAKIERNTSR